MMQYGTHIKMQSKRTISSTGMNAIALSLQRVVGRSESVGRMFHLAGCQRRNSSSFYRYQPPSSPSRSTLSASISNFTMRHVASTSCVRLPQKDTDVASSIHAPPPPRRIWQLPALKGSSTSSSETAYAFQPNTNQWTEIPEPSDKQYHAQNQHHPNASNQKQNQKQSKSITGILYQNTIHHLLPNGYPQTVSSGYAHYTLYSFTASVASTTTMVLSTQTLLLAVGVGQSAAAPISATLNWILKDGIGQFGGILFASYVSSSSSSSSSTSSSSRVPSMDADPKMWRMVSASAMDVGMLLELATVAFPAHFLLLASIANIGKNIAFLTASASRAKLHQCLTRGSNANGVSDDDSRGGTGAGTGTGKSGGRGSQVGGNLADVTAKSTSQSILASLVGTGAGIGLSPYLLSGSGGSSVFDSSDALGASAGAFPMEAAVIGCLVLSGVHQVFTYQSLKHVAMDTLSRERLMILLDLYFLEMSSASMSSSVTLRVPQVNGRDNTASENDNDDLRSSTSSGSRRCTPIVTPDEVSKHEHFLPFSRKRTDSHGWLKVGCGIEMLAPNGPHEIIDLHQMDEQYLLNYQTSYNGSNRNASSTSNGNVAIQAVALTFLEGACDKDILRGIFHAYALKGGFAEADTSAWSRTNKANSFDVGDDDDDHGGGATHDRRTKAFALTASHRYMDEHFPYFARMLCETGWKLNEDGETISITLESEKDVRIRL